MKYIVTIEGRDYEVEIERKAGKIYLIDRGKASEIDILKVGENLFSAIIEGRSYLISFSSNGKYFSLSIDGHWFKGVFEDERTGLIERFVGERKARVVPGEVKAPIPGLVVKIDVKEGDKVKKGQGLLVLEAMKMENEITASIEGTVSKIFVRPGQGVDKNERLILID
ncbi:MAG: biotin/lipoyl-containing protein [Fidelibacterota bacterium]